MSKYINLEAHYGLPLSKTACALLLPLALLANESNEINKKEFINIIKWIKDLRTWSKYWEELVENNVLIQLDKDTWMVSPYGCYAEKASHSTLINKWNGVRNATN